MKNHESHGTVLRKNNWLVAALIALVVVIVVLAVAIVVVFNHSERDGGMDYGQYGSAAEMQESINETLGDCYNIREAFENGSHDISKTIEEYEAAIEAGGVIDRVYSIMCYADFIYDYGDGIEAAVEIMGLAEPLPNNTSVKVSYYASFRDLYLEDGNEEMVKYYNNKLSEFLPSEAPEEMLDIVEEEE